MTDYLVNPTRDGSSTSDSILLGRKIIKIRLAKEDNSKRLIFNIENIFYFPNSLFNLVSLRLLNDAGIYYNNKNQILYNKISWKPLAFAQHWETSFLLHLLNFSASAINLLKANNNIYKNILSQVQVYQTVNNRLSLITWHQQPDHLNFSVLRKNLKYYNIKYNYDNCVYDSCKRAKAIKQYN